jgi:hypothetical protein
VSTDTTTEHRETFEFRIQLTTRTPGYAGAAVKYVRNEWAREGVTFDGYGYEHPDVLVLRGHRTSQG